MRLILILCFLFIQTGLQEEQSSNLPYIYGVCRVELNNGNVEEGMITLGTPGYYRYYANGFYFPKYHPPYGNPDFFQFNLEFDSLSFYGQRKSYYSENIESISRPDHLMNINDSILIRTKEEKFEIDEKFVLHQSPDFKWIINSNLFYKATPEEIIIVVKTSEIKQIELLRKPSQKWIDVASSIYQEYPGLRKTKPPFDKGTGLLWFHDIVNDHKMKVFLEKYFQPRY